jgi:hypothetical protein
MSAEALGKGHLCEKYVIISRPVNIQPSFVVTDQCPPIQWPLLRPFAMFWGIRLLMGNVEANQQKVDKTTIH